MDRFSDDFNRISEVARVKAAAQDFDDLNHAIADRDVGRYRRHIHDGGADTGTGGKRKSAAQRARETLEWLLLNDANYTQLYERAKSAVGKTAQTAQRVLDGILTKLADVRNAITDVLDRAMELPDGRRVFRDKDGTVRDEDGAEIADALSAGIIWQGNEPTFEEYRDLMNREAALRDATDEVRGIQTDLGDLNNQLDDNENPFKPEGLEDVSDRAGELDERLKKIQSDLQLMSDSHGELTAESEIMETRERSTANIPIVTIGK